MRLHRNPAPRPSSPDARIKGLVRQAQQANDPEAALQAIREAVRYGLWLVPRESAHSWQAALTNMHRVAALRFLAYCGWKEAESLLAALPLGDPEFDIHGFSSRRHAREGEPAYWPGHLKEGTPEHAEAVRRHRAYFRRVVPPRAFKTIGEEVAQEIGADVLRPAVRAALLLTVPLFAQRGDVDPTTLTEADDYAIYHLRIHSPLGWNELAFNAAVEGWGDYLRSSRHHSSDRPRWLAAALHQAIAAAEYTCMSEKEGVQAPRVFESGGSVVRSCARIANAVVKRAMLPAAAIAAAGSLA